MKPLLISFLILASLFIAGSMNYRTITHLSDSINAQLTLSAEAAQEEQWEEADAALQRANEIWKEHDAYLHIMVTHEELDTAEEILFEVRQYAQRRDCENYCSSAQRLCMQMDHLKDTQRISLQNIL